MIRNERRQDVQGLGDLALPDLLMESNIILQCDGSMVAVWEFTGPDLQAEGDEYYNAAVQQVNSILPGSR